MKLRKLLIIIPICLIAVPILIGIIVSIPSFKWLEISNDWIGFWGGYIGSIIGGLITLFVMTITLSDNRRLHDEERKEQLCNRVANLVSNFCIEMMAYRSKINSLDAQYAGKEIDPMSKIEIGATMEEPRRIYFELDILLRNIPEAKQLLTSIEEILNCKINQKTVKEASSLMNTLRIKTRTFIEEYTYGIPNTAIKENNSCDDT